MLFSFYPSQTTPITCLRSHRLFLYKARTFLHVSGTKVITAIHRTVRAVCMFINLMKLRIET